MHDGLNPCRQSEGRLRQFDRFMADGGTGGKDNKKKARSYGVSPIDVPTSAAATTTTESESESPPPGKKARAKESSTHFGVRFRPDLHKWVAEIRVFEWKSVDKKVWLGTFDSELGAACAVDAARKLLRCQKKREPNVPCAALSAYNESIPSHLQLTNISEEGMFKEVTMFVKRKAQEYAAGLCRSQGAATAVATAVGLREQLVAPQYQTQVGDSGNGFFHLPSDVDPPSRPLFSVPEEDVFPTTGSSYGTNDSFGSYATHCDGAVMSYHWGCSPATPTSMTYSSGPSSYTSSEGTSPEDGSWVQVHPSVWTEEALQGWNQEAPLDGDYYLVVPSSSPSPSWEDQMAMPVPMPMGMEDQTAIEFEGEDMEDLFNMDDVEDGQECGGVGEQAIDPMMNIFLADETQAGAQAMYIDNQYVNNQYGSWTFQ